MDIPDSHLNKEYTDEVKVIEANIKDIYGGEAPRELFEYIQKKLDKLAEHFQYDESIGSARYKLYELQAVLYYHQNKDMEALGFIKEAVRTRGKTYDRAEKLIKQLQDGGTYIRTDVKSPAYKIFFKPIGERDRLISLLGGLGLQTFVYKFPIFPLAIYFLVTAIGLVFICISAFSKSKNGKRFTTMRIISIVVLVLWVLLFLVGLLAGIRERS